MSRLWAAFRELPRVDPDVMSHGDLTQGNLLEAGPRQLLRAVPRRSDLEWERSRAWAFEQAMGPVWYCETSNPVMSPAWVGCPWAGSPSRPRAAAR
jgi:hypothetical protein